MKRQIFWNGTLVFIFMAGVILAMADTDNMVNFVFIKVCSILCFALMVVLREALKESGRIR